MKVVTKLGYSASAVCNGELALGYLDRVKAKTETRPDLILMDCMMPVMDGYQATTTIRKDEARYDEQMRTIPIIAMTASAIKGDRELCEQAGMNAFLSKPIVKGQFQSVVRRWTKQENGVT